MTEIRIKPWEPIEVTFLVKRQLTRMNVTRDQYDKMKALFLLGVGVAGISRSLKISETATLKAMKAYGMRRSLKESYKFHSKEHRAIKTKAMRCEI